MKIAGLVVLYNPEKDVWENINTYLDDIKVLYAIDNSENCDLELLEEIKKNDKIEYIDNHGNKGIAAALNTGAKLAIKAGYDWLLTMDQDSSFYDKSFFIAFNQLQNKEKYAIVSPSHEHSANKQENWQRSEFVDIIMTSGNIINLKVYSFVNGFTEKLFIDEVDHDYCLKCRSNNFIILKFSNIPLDHKLGYKLKRNNSQTLSAHSSIRYYYIVRNNLYFIKKWNKKFPFLVKQRIKNLIFEIVNIRFQKNRFSKGLMVIKGLIHFLFNRYGKF
jgi:rhamnosyltransferase